MAYIDPETGEVIDDGCFKDVRRSGPTCQGTFDKFKGELDKANETNKRLRKEIQVARCPCGGWLEGVGYDQAANTVVYRCRTCAAQIEIAKANP